MIRLHSLSFVAASLLLVAACSKEDSDQKPTDKTDASVTEPEPETDDDGGSKPGDSDSGRPSGREGPEGCYIVENHQCNCTVDEDECEEISGIWTTGCNSCAQSEDDDDESEVSGFGCYLPSSHTCDCDLDEPACDTASGVWTDQCTRCDGAPGKALADAGDEADAAAPNTAPGCYSPLTHVCDCTTEEAACAGVWTDQCGCPNSEE